MFSRITANRRTKLERGNANDCSKPTVNLNIEILSKIAQNQSSQEIMTFAFRDISK